MTKLEEKGLVELLRNIKDEIEGGATCIKELSDELQQLIKEHIKPEIVWAGFGGVLTHLKEFDKKY